MTEQLGLFLRDRGIDSVEQNNLTWVERMRDNAVRLSRIHGDVCADDLREIANRTFDQPEHVNAWGAVFRGRGWRVVGRRRSKTPTCHAREIKVWRFEEQKQ